MKLKNNIEVDLRNKLIDKGYSDDVMIEYHDGRMEASYRDNALKYLEERPIFIRRDQGND